MSAHWPFCYLPRVCSVRNSGMALVEVLVALAIVAIALPALLQSVDSVTEGTARIRDKTIAQWVASDRLKEVRINQQNGQATPSRESSGEVDMAGQQWSWRMVPQKVADENFIMLEVSVFQSSEQPLMTLMGVVKK